MQKYLNEHDPVIKFIHNASEHLKLTVLPRTTACMLYHSVVKKQLERKEKPIEKYLVGGTCLYLGAKLGEEPQKIRDVVNVCYRLLHPNDAPLEIGKSYWNLRDSITTCELMLLRLFQFDVSFETPHKYLLHYLKLIEDWIKDVEEWNASCFVQICWNLLNDSTHLPLISKHKPKLLATTIIYITSKTTMMEIPFESKPWFEVFCPSITEDDLEYISCEILQLYEYDGYKR